jgi:hypothetical protein
MDETKFTLTKLLSDIEIIPNTLYMVLLKVSMTVVLFEKDKIA